MRWPVFSAVAMVPLALSACDAPYSLTISDFDETGPQKAASIEISDPQIYTRENLINDRRKEVERLNEILAESKSKQFVPQLRRDLREISAFSASLRASINPALGTAAERADERAGLDQEIAMEDLKTKLAKSRERRLIAERRLSAVEGGETPTTQPPQGSSAPVGDATTGPPLPSLSDIRARLDSLSTKLDKVLAEPPKVVATDIPSTPKEAFRDEQAYRAEIRAAIAESNLDDVHDVGGNALYRLQFRATVLPGERKGQFGIARVRVEPTTFTAEELQDLYFAWLGHVTLQLNLPIATGVVANWRYETLGASSNLYDIVYFLPAGGEAPRNALRLAVIPPFGVGIQELLDQAASLPAFRKKLRRLTLAEDDVYDRLKEGEIIPADSAEICDAALHQPWVIEWFRTAALTSDREDLIRDLQRLQRFLPPMASSIRALQAEGSRMGALAGRALWDLLADLNQTSVLAQGVLKPLSVAFPHCPEFDLRKLRGELRDIPPSFLKPLIGVESVSTGDFSPPAGTYRTRTYAAKPVELVQRISTAASAANALELSLALAGTVPQSGVNAEAAAGYMRAAMGRMEALERAPIVVGYATQSSGKGDAASTEFGWVFGPSVVPDTEKNKLERLQRVVNHQVFADVSVPGWWPRMKLEIETAWVANWHQSAEGALRADNEKRTRGIEVELPRTRASLETLTDTVSRREWGRQPGTTQIYDVEPKSVYFCPGRNARFLIYGSDVWRNTSVFLNGTEANSGTVRVLPDMTGVTAEFELSKVAKVAPVGGRAEGNILTVWTQDGSDSFDRVQFVAPPNVGVCDPPQNQDKVSAFKNG